MDNGPIGVYQQFVIYVSIGRRWVSRQLDPLAHNGQWWMLPVLLGVTVGFAFVPGAGADYINVFYHASERAYVGFYYPQWAEFLLKPFDLLPPVIAYAAFLLFQSTCLVIATRCFGGDLRAAFLNYSALSFLFYGQMEGVVILGLAALKWGLERDQPSVASLGLIAALVKPQVGLPLALFFLIKKWRWEPVVSLAIVVATSLVLWPGWPSDLAQRLLSAPPDTSGNISLWQYTGPAALLLWIPALLIPMSDSRRQVVLAATSALGLPYFQMYSPLLLYVMPVGWWPLLGNIVFLGMIWGGRPVKALALVPACVYLVWIAKSAREARCSLESWDRRNR